MPRSARAVSESVQAAGSRRVLLSNIAWMLAGNVSYGLSQWALLVALAKIGTLEMVGSFAMAIAISLPVLMFSSLSLRSLQVTDYKKSFRFLEYAALRTVTVTLSTLIILGFGMATGYRASALVSITLIGAAKAIESLSDILYGLLQQQEDMAGVAVSMILRASLSVTALSVGVHATHSLLWGSIALLAVSAGVFVGYDIPKMLMVYRMSVSTMAAIVRRYTQQLRAGGYLRLWKLGMAGLPMGFVLMMVSLNLSIPRYFIQHSLGMAELGIFSAIATLMSAGSVITNAIGQAAAPRLAKYFAIGDRRGFATLLGAITAASLGLGAAGYGTALFFGPSAMALIYRPEYSTRQDVLLWLMGASGFYYLGSTLGYAVTAARCFTPQLPLFTVAAITTGLACLAMVPSHGLRGAAIAILISAAVQCAGSAGLLFRSLRAGSQEAVVVAA
ncbi:MAG: lipopolysaccharide biosynthesis protein [Bryobacteraceae bacterium]